ncbi:MAG: type I-E CRISPR-associated protein Cas7/Cse4/CasC [Hydrogenophaga sp.]|uniref:type I-E CRISPR-associated protein Cas7/Cse4/CasC n=1 Tax=Hydrogenophaga sp. TaxID=1904254 RepID=UPI00271BE77A|nr:type I-E CRISPR-associated protein Cas7/Cse4/CasC [Hydrogenophaga sp.]MDO9147011.1 type I-E CRISPR-associated protein Cas7/Cse4/CasC [Hydrogenophaga sp.]MDO9603408.1 type I-E CRISPR-associated protein Cas7/Cse4/CasC [Hydrogenophaga sp.]
MNLPRFIQIHTLHNYPGTLLNRDDAGLAKRLPYGDAVRTRISSQCLKRHWRTAEDHFSLSNLGVPMAVRSRQFVERIRESLIGAGINENIANVISSTFAEALKKDLGKLMKAVPAVKKGKKKSADIEAVADDADNGETVGENSQKQAVLLGVAEYEYLTKIAIEVGKQVESVDMARHAFLMRLKSEQANLAALPLNCGLESALFGRMVTSDVLASRDAAVYVAHAFTVHAAQVENDYFTVVDDLLREAGELGSAGIFDTELASGLYYGYVVVDVPQLIANLEGEKSKDWATLPTEKRELAGRVVQHLLHLIATVSPGAKRGSTAPFDWAKFLLVEVGDWQPRSLAGAFQNALPTEHAALRETAVQMLADEIGKLDGAYGATLDRRFLALDKAEVPNAQRLTLNDLATWVQAYITQGAAPAQVA